MSAADRIEVYFNGNVYIKYIPLTVVESIVIRNGRVEDYGISSHSLKRFGKIASSIVDLKGRTILPGFIDSHIHLEDVGGALNVLDVRGVNSIEELKAKLRKFRDTNPLSRILIGMGWDHERFEERRWPTSKDLDSIENEIPVFLERYCEHAAVANSKMLQLIGDEHFPNQIFPRDEQGSPLGIVKEGAYEFLKIRAQEISDTMEKNILRGSSFFLENGVTSVGYVSCSEEAINAISKNRDAIRVRIRAYLNLDLMDRYEEIRERVGADDYLKINGIKLLVDGALGARTAFLREPYSDDPDNKGYLVLDEKDLLSIGEKSYDRDLQLAIHVLGDAGLDTILSAFSKLDRTKMIRTRMEHCVVVRQDQIKRIGSLGLAASIGPASVIDDYWVVNRLGPDRCRLAYPLTSLLNEGIRLGISTDAPIEPVDPWFTLDASVNRGQGENISLLRHSEQEKTDLATALYLYTEGSAWLIREEGVLGNLERAKMADFIVVDIDPFSINDLRKIRVSETYVGGNKEYSSNDVKGSS